MQSILPIAAVMLALIAAGSIAYVAWELLKEVTRPGDDVDDANDSE